MENWRKIQHISYMLVGFLAVAILTVIWKLNKSKDLVAFNPNRFVVPALQRPPSFHFITYGNEKFAKSKQRIVNEANQTGWFDSIRAFGPDDLPTAFQERYHDILQQTRGGGYWVWKFFLIERALEEIDTGDFLLYLDAGCEVNAAAEPRFREYVAMLSASPFDILTFQLKDFREEHKWTTERVFQALGVDAANSSIRDSAQYLSGIILARKGEQARRLLSMVRSVQESDPWLFSDKYNDEAHRLDPEFVDARNDQSVFSISAKLVGSVVLKDETYPPGQEKYPFWASRLRQ